MSVSFFNIDISRKVKNRRAITAWIDLIILHNSKSRGYINIILTSDNYLQNLNLTYLNRDYLTDIITFNYNEGNIISGDLYISLERIFENASLYNTHPSNELSRVIAHGVLHLLGYGDESPGEQQAMRKAEDSALSELSTGKII